MCRHVGAAYLHSAHVAAFDCGNFIAALLCPTGGSILLQTRRDKEETGRVFAGHCWSGSRPANRMAITTDFLHPSPELGLSAGALTLQYPEGKETGAVKSHTSPCSQRGVLLQLLAHGGPHCTLLLISSISGRNWPLVDVGSFFSPLLSRAPLKSCVSVSLWLERVR